jgi:hypothetical protein
MAPGRVQHRFLIAPNLCPVRRCLPVLASYRYTRIARQERESVALTLEPLGGCSNLYVQLP